MLSQLQTRKDVANYLGFKTEKEYKYFCYIIYGKREESNYKDIYIPKRKGGYRNISIPDSRIKLIQSRLYEKLKSVYPPRKCVYGFVENRNCIKNAERHVNKQVILNIDLKDFFSQIHFGRIKGVLMAQPYNVGVEAAKTIANIVCYGLRLPQGAPTSPILSNMVAYGLDTRLTKLAQEYQITYTRYADDITFSTTRKAFPKEIVVYDNNNIVLGSKLRAIFSKTNFIVNDEKVHLRTKYERQEVTGLTVNEKINVRRSYLNELRIIFHNCEEYSLYKSAERYLEVHKHEYLDKYRYCKNENEKQENKEEYINSWFLLVLKGKIDYLRQVRGNHNSFYIKYAKKYNSVVGDEVFDIKESLDFIKQCENSCYVIENKSGTVQGTGFYIKDFGIITNHHVIENDDIYFIKKVTGDKETIIRTTMNSTDWEYQDEDIDYAINPTKFNDTSIGWRICDNPEYTPGTDVYLVSFPNYSSGDSHSIEKSTIIGKKKQGGRVVTTVNARIFHGASGGAVLNENFEVIGVIECGPPMEDEEKSQIPTGFIKISEVLENINLKSS